MSVLRVPHADVNLAESAMHPLPGHGDPWHGSAEEAVAIARRTGTQ